jgi:hypothetical protein
MVGLPSRTAERARERAAGDALVRVDGFAASFLLEPIASAVACGAASSPQSDSGRWAARCEPNGERAPLI